MEGSYGTAALLRDPKPRLRWTPELHERFVDAVTKLGGPDSEFSLTILRSLASLDQDHLLYASATDRRFAMLLLGIVLFWSEFCSALAQLISCCKSNHSALC